MTRMHALVTRTRNLALLFALAGATLLAPASLGAQGSAASGCWSVEPSMEMGFPQWAEAPAMIVDSAKAYTATVETSHGTMVFALDASAAPTTVNNFVCLATSGYYDFTLFHRVMVDFMIQGGDPTATGTGGPGYQFADELPSGETPYTRGTLAMANSGANTNGSQFFIVHQDLPAEFPANYSIFGHISEGEDVLDALATIPVTQSMRGEMSDPIATVGIIRVTIQVDGQPFEG
jgi:cyclophilin family peptidyl-prolyl cis-trans isomerase